MYSRDKTSDICFPFALATLPAFSIGTYLSWTSSALPLYNRNNTLSVSDQEGSWISSLVPLGAIPIIIPAGILADKFGRKRTIWAITVSLFLCWYIIGFARSKIWWESLLYFKFLFDFNVLSRRTFIINIV